MSLASDFGRDRVKEAVSAHLADIRSRRSGWDESLALVSVTAALGTSISSGLRPVINGTGVIIHTNLGRSPIDRSLWLEAGSVVTAYANLEFDLAGGDRGKRDEHLISLCKSLFGCESAVLTNNNAAAVLLLLSAIAAKKEVLVSRGELVEIGGGFRVPEVIQQGGAKLHEVGTTNRTRSQDYADGVTRKTAAILRVHRSNFDIVGFTATPAVDELVDVARRSGVAMLYDEGTGRVVDLEQYGFSRALTIRELFAAGVDVITCSTDKLIGATQGGLILGRRTLIERCTRHPLMRAVRAGKESYAVIGATLRAFATGRHEQTIPIYRMLATSIGELKARAEELVRGTGAHVVDSRAVLGGGTTPGETIASVSVAISGSASDLHSRFRSMSPPIVGRVADNAFTIDLRTVLPEELPLVRAALQTVR